MTAAIVLNVLLLAFNGWAGVTFGSRLNLWCCVVNAVMLGALLRAAL